MSYTAHVVLPFLAAAVLVYPILAFVLFRGRGLIPTTLGLELDDHNTRTLLDKHGAIFGSALLLVTLAVLVGTSTVGVPVWEVTVPPAVIMLIRDGVHDWRHRQKSQNSQLLELAGGAHNLSPRDLGVDGKGATQQRTKAASQVEDVPSPSLEIDTTSTIASPVSIASCPSPCLPSPTQPNNLSDWIAQYVSQLREIFPTATTILSRLPVALLPFAFLMFILVQALSSKGWVEVFARWWAAWITKTGTLGAIGGMGLLACIFCNVRIFFFNTSSFS